MIHPHDLYSTSEPWTVRIKNIACQFKKKGHSVKLVYFPLNSHDINREFISNDIEVIALDRRLGVVRLFRNIARIIKLSKWSDIIHFQKCYYYVSLPALIAALLNNKPVHYDWDDWETKIFYYSNASQFIVGEFINVFEKLIPKMADTISVSSGYLRNICLSAGIPNENVFPAHVGADLEEFRPNSNLADKVKEKYRITGQLVLYVGQLHGGQYAELFVKAANSIIKEGKWDVRFMIVGDGYRLDELKRLASELNVGKNFIFAGFIPHKDVPSYINAADICVACFEDNAITRCKSPLKIAEYLACGKAIVASNVGEVRNMAGGVGVLTIPGEVDSLADGIKMLLEDKELRVRLGEFARIRAENKYNWSVTAENILKAYEKTVKCSFGGDEFPQDKEMAEMVKSAGNAKSEQGFNILTVRVSSVTSHSGGPYTIEYRIKKFLGERSGAFTIDPRCTFYKDDKVPKMIGIVKPGDKIEATYLVHAGIKVAFNIIVKPK